MGRGEFRDVSRTAGSTAEAMRSTMLPEYGNLRERTQQFGAGSLAPAYGNIEAWRQTPSADLAAARGVYSGMISDPSKRGYSSETQKAMRGAATGAVAGAAKSAKENIGRQVAASGMGKTGLGMRLSMQQGRDTAKQMREANRDVDLQQAEAARSDLWNATQGMMSLDEAEQAKQATAFGLGAQNLGMQGNLFNTELGAMAGEQGVYNQMNQFYNTQLGALEQANKPGFWGNFLNSLGQGMGTGLASTVF